MNKRLLSFTLVVFLATANMTSSLALAENPPVANDIETKVVIPEGKASPPETKALSINKALPSLLCIDAPANGGMLSAQDLYIQGWALHAAEVQEVNIYLNNNFVSKAILGIYRPDVNTVFPGYPGGISSGFYQNIKIQDLTLGNYNITVEAVGKDGTKISNTVNLTRKVLPSIVCIDYPQNGVSAGNSKFGVSGWSLNQSGIKDVNIYVNDKLQGQAAKGIYRPDVNSIFPGYTDGDKSGYYYELDASKMPQGRNKITVECIGNNGTKKSSETYVNVSKPVSRMCLDTKLNNIAKGTEKLKLRGWALNASGVQDIKFYVDEKERNSSYTVIMRPDVNMVFPGYIGGDKSGYEADVDISSLDIGKHTLRIESIGNDGGRTSSNYSVNVISENTMLVLDYPKQSSSMKGSIFIGGWTLNASGIKELKTYIDGNEKASFKTGIYRPDVDNIYPGYIGGRECGFGYSLDTTTISRGSHVLTIESIGNNGSVSKQNRTIIVDKQAPIMCLDTQLFIRSSQNNLGLSGWCLDSSNVKEVQVYVNENMVGKASYGIYRPDVNKAFPGYPSGNFSGFYYNLDVTELTGNSAALTIVSIGNDGTRTEIKGTIQIRRQTIVIDPGHNHGNNDGAYAVHDGIQYCERELNMQLARKLADNLMARGYNVILTRTENDRFYEGVSDNLARVVGIANGSNAELFVSIHHDWSEATSPNGVSTHYSSWRPNLDNEGLYNVGDITYDLSPTAAASASARLAQQIVNAASSLGYMNRGALDHNLYVTRNTNMVSLLIEAGFLTNKGDAIRCANTTKQQEFANKIAETIEQYFQKK